MTDPHRRVQNDSGRAPMRETRPHVSRLTKDANPTKGSAPRRRARTPNRKGTTDDV